jgi:UDP-N-acetylglucosamine 3-dehydrogenase
MERKINVAVIGAGAIAQNVHIPIYSSNKYVNLAALVDSDLDRAKKMAKKFHVKEIYKSCDELFKQNTIDAISLCTPPNSHEEIVLKAFDHGAHVLCEKPLTNSVESGIRMVTAAKSKKKILTLGCHRRFLPNYIHAKKNILDGKLGNVFCIEDHFLEPHPLFEWAKSPWYVEPGIGGVISDIAPHVFDTMNYFFDDYPIAVSAHSSTYLNSRVEEMCAFFIEYPNKRLGMGTISWQAPKVIEFTNIYGTGRSLHISPSFFLRTNPSHVKEIVMLRASLESFITMKLPKMSFINTERGNSYEGEINNFIDKIRNADFSELAALNALSVLEACEATRESCTKNCRVEIPSPRRLLS